MSLFGVRKNGSFWSCGLRAPPVRKFKSSLPDGCQSFQPFEILAVIFSSQNEFPEKIKGGKKQTVTKSPFQKKNMVNLLRPDFFDQ